MHIRAVGAKVVLIVQRDTKFSTIFIYADSLSDFYLQKLDEIILLQEIDAKYRHYGRENSRGEVSDGVKCDIMNL